VDKPVEQFGRTRGNGVGNTRMNGKQPQPPLGYPRLPHTGCA
jgi:hypothetical protein